MSSAPHPAHEPQHQAAAGRVGAWTEIGALLGLAGFLGFSFFSGRVNSFLVWPYVWLPPIAALVLLAMCTARLIAHLRGKRWCGCERQGGSPVSQFACAAILIAPILFALWVNPTQFSAEGARKRRASRPPQDAELEQAMSWVLGLERVDKRVAGGPIELPASPTVLDLLTATTEYRPQDIEGRFVTVVGQCDLPEGAASPRFDLYRLVVTCCIADATTVSIEIARKPGVRLDSGGWVRVAGRIKFDNPVDPALPVVHAAGPISKIPEPQEPYL